MEFLLHSLCETATMQPCSVTRLLISAALAIATAATVPAVAAEIADFTLPDHLGKNHALSEMADCELVVVAFLGTECPLAKLYAGRLQRIANDYADRSVAVVAVDRKSVV